MAFGVPRPQDGPVPFGSLEAPQAAPAVPSQIGPLAQAMNAPPLENKPKMNWLGILADALAGAAGRPGPYAAMMGQQRELQMQQQLAQQNSDRELQRTISAYDYERTHPKPIVNDTVNDYNFWKNVLSPEQFNNWLDKQTQPLPTYQNVPGVGLVQVPRTAAPAPRPLTDADIDKLGGQTPSASGTFHH